MGADPDRKATRPTGDPGPAQARSRRGGHERIEAPLRAACPCLFKRMARCSSASFGPTFRTSGRS